MTKTELTQFIDERHSLNLKSLCDEADISRKLLYLILKDDRTLTETTARKLLPVMIKYGYQQ